MKRLSLAPQAIERARSLRRSNTEAEARLWRALRSQLAGAKFRRQVPIGPYFADFASHAAQLIIEVDGSQHVDNMKDEARTAFLNAEGYRVLRFWNNQVLGELDLVLAAIHAALPSPLVGEGAAKRRMRGLSTFVEPLAPSPLPQGEREGLSKSKISESV